MTSKAIVPYNSDAALERADAWARLADDERKRRAMAAAQNHNAAALWDLTLSWLILHGAKGARVSAHTTRNYHTALVPRPGDRQTNNRARPLGVPLLSAWTGENLLRPARLAGTRWLRQLEGDGLKASTVRIYLAAARALYAALRAAGATEADPFKDTRAASDPVPRWEKRQPYTQEEVGRLLAAATPDDEILVLLGAHAGLHASEMAALRWADVDLATRHLVVASGKGGKRRTVGLSRSLYLELVAARRRAGYVLPLNGEDDLTKRRMHAWYRLRQLCRKTGVQPRALHALRHTAGTRLMSENHDLELAAGVLGHSSIETTRIYSHFSDTRADKAVADW